MPLPTQCLKCLTLVFIYPQERVEREVVTGECLGRVSWRALLLKKWAPCFWVVKKDKLIVYRKREDFLPVRMDMSFRGHIRGVYTPVFRVVVKVAPSMYDISATESLPDAPLCAMSHVHYRILMTR